MRPFATEQLADLIRLLQQEPSFREIQSILVVFFTLALICNLQQTVYTFFFGHDEELFLCTLRHTFGDT